MFPHFNEYLNGTRNRRINVISYFFAYGFTAFAIYVLDLEPSILQLSFFVSGGNQVSLSMHLPGNFLHHDQETHSH